MSIPVSQLVRDMDPLKTVLLFGSGSSVPSGAPSVGRVIKHLAEIGATSGDYALSELAGIVEKKTSRKKLIGELRTLLAGLKPTGGLLNLPLYDWKSIYTTNYDDLIEQVYRLKPKDLIAYSSDFDFTVHGTPGATKLFKLHGTIEKDESDGNRSRIIITDRDYDLTADYREQIWNRFRGDLAGAALVIVGHSLADKHIKDIVAEAAHLQAKAQGSRQITLLLYTKDDDRAGLYEERGINVCFGGIDEFFAALATKLPPTLAAEPGAAPLDKVPALRPVTVDVSHAWNAARADVSAMFNGWPASYADIASGATFERVVADEIARDIMGDKRLNAVILGASGVGKTTAARQALGRLRSAGAVGFEHRSDYTLNVGWWLEIAAYLKRINEVGVLFVDDGHEHLREINELLDKLAATQNFHLRLIIASGRNHWQPRVKTPVMARFGKSYHLSQLSGAEIERLLTLVDAHAQIRALVEPVFSGFSRAERRRRLDERCGKDMFVCLKNVFASEKFDDIILRDYASMDGPAQDVYRHVAAMEAAGVRVHRQLVIRLLGIPADAIAGTLTGLSDIVHEYSVDEKEGIYGWRVRHPVIASIVARYKFPGMDNFISLIERVIDFISPTYEIEIRTIRELCNVEHGVPRIPSKETQNRLIRKMMSIAPGERVPRHRLIRNLIDMREFEKAETEIRIFDKDFGTDGPAQRYKVNLMIARAKYTPNILEEDRIAILDEARAPALAGIERFPYNKNLLAAYADLAVEYLRRTGKYAMYDDAMAKLKHAEEEFGDPEISKMIARYENRVRQAGTIREDDEIEVEGEADD